MKKNYRAAEKLPPSQPQGVIKVRNTDWLVVDQLPISPHATNTNTTATISLPVPSPTPKKAKNKLRPKLRLGWSFWGLLSLLVTTGAGVSAVMMLLKVPALPNCPSMFLPTASSSMRLYCAELAANKQTVDNLLEAIALLKELPPDHPMKAQMNEYIAQWSKDILALGNDSFQRGQLEAAIATARKIPSDTPAYSLVDQQIKKWQDLWQKADALYQQAEQALREGDWPTATRFSAQLLNIENRYWAENKYTELLEKGKQAREDAKQLNRAYQLVSMGSISNLIEAIELAKSVNPNSYAYNPAQKIIQDASQKLLNIAKVSLDNEDWQGIIQVANRLARVIDTPEAKRLDELAQAIAKSQDGTAAGLSSALARLDQMDRNNPFYDRLQRLSLRWRREIDGLESLERARQLAGSGRSVDILAAIAQARLVPQTSPRFNEATTQIRRWTEQVEGGEDRPILARADQLAGGGNTQAYQAAIQQASLIAPNRALYREAQEKISRWSTRIEADQDQPYLDQAQGLARAGNYQDAINFASQIQNGRSLYSQAQTNIRTWQASLNSQNRSTTAPVPEVPSIPSSPDTAGANNSQLDGGADILATAQGQARTNLQRAIATAQTVPTSSTSYATAQSQIQEWQQQSGGTSGN